MGFYIGPWEITPNYRVAEEHNRASWSLFDRLIIYNHFFLLRLFEGCSLPFIHRSKGYALVSVGLDNWGNEVPNSIQSSSWSELTNLTLPHYTLLRFFFLNDS